MTRHKQFGDSIVPRHFVTFAALAVGAFLGWGFVEWMWRAHHQWQIGWIRPERGLAYFVFASLCSVGGSVFLLGVVRFRELPNGEDHISRKN
jgi:high-affinity Fe2+/Pb2+ permease